MSNKILANQHVTVLAGLASGVSDWVHPPLSELAGFTNVSGAVNWAAFSLNLQASAQKTDTTLTDGAGSQSRSPYINFGGDLQFVHPQVTDSSSIFRTAYNLFSTPRVELAVAVRYGPLNSTAPAAADKWTIYHVIVDAVSFGANEVSRFYLVSLVARDDIVLDYVVPVATPTTVTTAALAVVGTVASGTLIFASAAYQGWEVTKKATWVSSDPTKLVLVHPGIFKCVGAGSATIVAQYPGGTDSTALTVTIS